jgi:hypothetical protein
LARAQQLPPPENNELIMAMPLLPPPARIRHSLALMKMTMKLHRPI